MRACARVKWRFLKAPCRCRSATDQNISIKKMVGFFVKPTIFVSLRGGRIFAPDAAIFDGTKRHLGTKYEKNGTKQNRKISRDQTNRGSITLSVVSMTGIFSLCAPCSHYGHHFSFCSPCFVPGCHAFDFKIAAAALRPRNDTNLERFYLENGRSAFLRLFSAQCRPASFFKGTSD